MSSTRVFTEKDELFFVTSTVVDWIDVFTRMDYTAALYDSIRFCQIHKGLVVYGYVIMSNHMHLIVSSDGKRLSWIFRDLKRHTAKTIFDLIEKNPAESRKKWMLNQFQFRGKFNPNNEVFQFWQQGNHPIPLWSSEVIRQKLHYIHQNPVKAGLVREPEHYFHSSALDYAGGKGLLDVVLLDVW
jgi:REP element-mobilizing transposase RayT